MVSIYFFNFGPRVRSPVSVPISGLAFSCVYLLIYFRISFLRMSSSRLVDASRCVPMLQNKSLVLLVFRLVDAFLCVPMPQNKSLVLLVSTRATAFSLVVSSYMFIYFGHVKASELAYFFPLSRHTLKHSFGSSFSPCLITSFSGCSIPDSYSS